MRFLLIAFFLAAAARPAAAVDFDTQRAALAELAAQPFARDACEVESELDRRSFTELNDLPGITLLDDGDGWSVIARGGGRPFYCFASIAVDDVPWIFDSAALTSGSSGIEPEIVDAHLALGKGVNRFWFTHRASNGHPIVVVLTADGFLNLAGASAPLLFGAVTRMGLIGEPFTARDWAQHVGDVRISRLPRGRLRLLLAIHSEAGESTVELELGWDSANESPLVSARASIQPRVTGRLGFVGLNFMRGPTLYGADAFHDGRTLFVVRPDGDVVRAPLVAPLGSAAPAYEDLAFDVAAGTRLVLDQPQDTPTGYFSRHPGVPYEARADLVVELGASKASPVRVRKAQVAVDLDDVNPEANETVNAFFAVDAKPLESIDVAWRAEVAAEDFETQLGLPAAGIVYVSSAPGQASGLAFVPVRDAAWSGPPIALTDAAVRAPHRLRVSADGRWIAFDAEPRRGGQPQPYLLDRVRSAVRLAPPADTSVAWTSGLEDLAPTARVDARVSPDGALTFDETPDGVVVTSRDGERRLELARASSPFWIAPDRLAVLREKDGETDLYLVSVEHAALLRLTPADGRNVSEPSWAPLVREPLVEAFTELPDAVPATEEARGTAHRRARRGRHRGRAGDLSRLSFGGLDKIAMLVGSERRSAEAHRVVHRVDADGRGRRPSYFERLMGLSESGNGTVDGRCSPGRRIQWLRGYSGNDRASSQSEELRT